jgi:hypothetical protein
MSPSDVLVVVLVLATGVGHAFLWVGVTNWIHSLNLSHRRIQLASGLCWAASWCILAALAWRIAAPLVAGDRWGQLAAWSSQISREPLAGLYGMVCGAALVREIGLRLQSKRHAATAEVLRENDTSPLYSYPKATRPATRGIAAAASRLPGNQLLWPLVQEKSLALARLPPALVGLKIAHLSDLHFSGRIGPEFFSQIVERTNAWRPDLVAITGDIVDRAACFGWLAETLGRLRAEQGVYFVLGNHDQRVDSARVRSTLVELGVIDLGKTPRTIERGGAAIHLAGNELPWFGPPTEPPPRVDADAPDGSSGELRVLLSHSPDQIRWAQRREIDLMLAGHTHGGQIRLPLLGPLVSPSRYGACYAGGTFLVGSTVLHVSRGLSSMSPLRFNCPPELALLRLEAAPRPAR